MEHIFEKLSQYSIVTNILPGSVLCLMLKYIVGYDLVISNNICEMFMVFYLVGMVNNRIGSIFVKKCLQKLSIIKEESYESFIDAETKDSKLVQLSQENNIYRCYISVALLTLLAKIYKLVDALLVINIEIVEWIGLVLFLLLFVLSYRKQSEFIKKRIYNVNKRK